MQRAPTCENCQKNFELQDYRPSGKRIPLLLPCGHTFCEGCLLKSAKGKTELICFCCEALVPLEATGDAGVRNLLPNIYLLGLLLYNRRVASDKITGGPVSTFNGIGNIVHSSNSSLSPAQSPNVINGENSPEKCISCDECNDSKATCQCLQCDGSMFCERCFNKVHGASKLLMKHVALPIENSNKEQLMCPSHNGRKLEFYDKNSAEAVCAICIISEKCRGHDVILLSELTSESVGKVINAVEKAKDTLFWWDYSSRALSKELPTEYMEANQLFCKIQSNFNAFHTLLQKRQFELMQEAATKIVAGGSVQDSLQDLSSKKILLDSLLKDIALIMKDKSLMQLKSEEYLSKLNEFIDKPCIVRRRSVAQDLMKFTVDDEVVNKIEKFGTIDDKIGQKLIFQKADDLPEELKEELKRSYVITGEDEEDVEKNDIIVEEDLNNRLQKFSLLSGYNELVCVTDITNPTEFKVQRLADKDRLQVLMTDLNKYCRYQSTNHSENLIYSVEEGQLLCAQFLSDQYWYRARVTNKFSKEYPDIVPTWGNNLSVEVLYIDYGNKEWLPLNRLRKIPKQFLQVPEMAVTCSLTDIVPPCRGENWPERSKKAFTSLTGDRPMLMNIRKRVGCTLHVDLRKPDDDEQPTRDDDRPASVRDALVFLEVAAFLSPASFPNLDLHKSVRKYRPHDTLSEGEFVDVLVTHVEDPEVIFVQKLTSTIAEEQVRLSHVYNNARNKKGWIVDYPFRNFVCAAKFSADKSWYRARVLNVNNDDTVEVEYVDYGNCEILPFKDLRRIPDMYLEMTQQCFKVKMHGLELPQGEDKWSQASKDFILKFILGKSLVTVIKSISENGVPIVEFYDTTTKDDVNMNKLVEQFILKAATPLSCDDIIGEQPSVAEAVSMPSVQELPSFACYLPPVFPEQHRFAATGVHVDENARIFLHAFDKDISIVTNIMQHLNVTIDTKDFANSLTSTAQLRVGQAVIAKFSQDNLWYRVEIIQVIDDFNVTVRYIDFGNVEVANVSSIYPEPMFVEVAAQCIGVELADVRPCGEDKHWSTQVISVLKEYIISEEVGVELKRIIGTDDDGVRKAIIYIDGNTSLKDLLVQQKLVDEIHYEPKTIETGHSSPSHDSDYLWYIEGKLPNPGVKFDVVVPQINQPDVVYIQRIPSIITSVEGIMDDVDVTHEEAKNNTQLLEEISEMINEEGYFDQVGLNQKPVLGMACIGKYSADGQYYRAKIVQLNEEEGVADVLYVDWGTSETLPIESLIAMPESLMALPMQATKVSIAGLTPVPPAEDQQPCEMLKGTGWTVDSLKFFYSLAANKRLIAEIVDYENELPNVRLYECQEKEGAIDYLLIADEMKLRNFSL